MKRFVLMLAALAFALPAFAQCGYFTQPTPNASGQSRWTMQPQVVPSSATTICNKNFQLTSMVFTNVTGTAATITVTDNQSSPIALTYQTVVPANGELCIVFPDGVFMPGGIIVTSGTTSALVMRGNGF